MEPEQQIEADEVVAPIDFQSSIVNSPLQQLFRELQKDPSGFTDAILVDRLFAATKIAFGECYNARLPQTAQILFNQVGLGLSLLQRILLTRHGVVQAVEPPPEEQKSSLIIT